MMAPEQVTDREVFLDVVGNMDVVCDYNAFESCPKDPARWIVTLAKCPCGAGGHRLICSTCKDTVMNTESGLLCGSCERELWSPARLAFVRIDPLG